MIICGHCSYPNHEVKHDSVEDIRRCWKEIQNMRLQFSVMLSQSGLDKDDEFLKTIYRIMAKAGW